MVNFWEGQIDYIIFLYGLGLVILSAVCFSLNKAGYRLLPWTGLLWFGIFHGLYEWLELAAFSLGSGMRFMSVGAFLLLVSYIFLVEFGRSGIKSIAGRGPGRWIFIPLLALGALGGIAGPEGLNVSMRYALGVTGGLLASAALLLASGKQSGVYSPKLKAGGLGMALFAAAQIMGAGFAPASFFNRQTFMETFRLPVELVQVILIFLTAMSLWSYLLARRRSDLDLSERYRGKQYVTLIVTNVVLILAVGWGATCYWGDHSLAALRESTGNNVGQLALILKGELAGAGQGAASLSGSPWIVPALVSRSPGDIERATSVLTRYQTSLEASDCFLVDRGGRVVASAGGKTAESQQGSDYGSMLYIKKALSGEASWYFEPGGKPGLRYYYSGYPVCNNKGDIVGAAVIKKNISGVEKDFSQYPYCFLVDQDGYIYLSNNEKMHYIPLWPSSGENPVNPVLPGKIHNGAYIMFMGDTYLVGRRDIGNGGWSVLLLSSTGQVWVYRLFCICITLVLSVLIIVFFTALMSIKESAGRISVSERRYHSLVEGSPNCVKLFNREGRFVTINRQGLIAMGWTESDLIGTKFSDVWPEETRPMVEKAVEKVLQGERCSFESTCYRSDGKRLNWDVTLYPIYEEDGGCRHFVGISTDVSERRRTEEALRENETRFRTLFDSANDAIIIMDGTSFEDCNPKTMEMFDCDRGQIIGQTLGSFSPERQPDGSPSEEKAVEIINAVLGGESKYFQWRNRRLDGTLFDTEISLNRINLKDRFFVQAILRDITRREIREEQLRLHAAALQSAANAIVITDLNGRITWINPAFTSLTGYTSEEAIGHTMSILRSGTQDSGFYRDLWETVFSGKVWRGEMENRHKSGSLYTEEQTITPVRDDKGKITHFVAIKQDVTDRKQQEQQLSYLATHDPLTSLPNRRVLEDALKRAVARTGRGSCSSLLFMDLDNFKLVNDTLGHTAGDQVLFTLTRVLQSLLRTGDLLVRFGGDEFSVLLERVSSVEALNIAERMRREVEEHRFTVDGQDFHLTLSIGLVNMDGEHSSGVILSQADTAMYMAKEQGKNRVVVYRHEDGVLARLTEVSKTASDIKTALSEDRFILYFQPLVRVSNDSIDHYEALVRMIGENGAIILPGNFIPVAERYGLMSQLDRWVFKHVISTLQNNPGIRLFMNLSGSSLADESLTAYVEKQIAQSGINPGRLGFEITETAVVQDMVAAERWVRRIKALGCRFALDDFGAGFNSFIYLHNLPVDQIKIDGYYIRTLETDPTRCALVKAMHALARTLGMETVAEFVENEAIMQIIKGIGITYGQGFHIDKPNPGLPAVEK